MVVTEVRKSSFSKKLTEVYIDYEYAFSLYENQIKKFNIKENLEIDNYRMEEIIKEVKKNALNDALRTVLISDSTKGIIKKKLKSKKYPDEIIDYVINYIDEKGYVDDFDYAINFAKAKFRTGKGKKYIEAELFKKGIDSNIICSVISDFYDESKIYEVADMKLSSLIKGRQTPDYKDLCKLKDYLLRQGYEYSEVSDVISKVKGKYED
ncbi:MAG: RecX family transcriptional regulator [Clostridia bacterium]|nr:RecX family transcriptional regulator [Clostridia bacterium]